MVDKLRDNILSCFAGKKETVDNVLICLLSGGHILLEDVPGVGKTTLAKALAGSIDCSFGRIQFTPDTLPSDVCGVSIYNAGTGEFEYREGVIMHQIVLADEINRSSPKTQSALLEAMGEGQVSVDGKVYKLPEPFIVIATQNPVEFLGTYPLSEAELDRFMMKISLGYPEMDDELRMAGNFIRNAGVRNVSAVCSTEDIFAMRRDVDSVHISEGVLRYVYDIVNLTRNNEYFVLGASPRATLALIKASQACAYLDGRDFVKPDDVKKIVQPVLLHRLVLTSEARIRKENAGNILRSLVLKAKLPIEG